MRPFLTIYKNNSFCRHVQVISKIENEEGVDLEDIIQASERYHGGARRSGIDAGSRRHHVVRGIPLSGGPVRTTDEMLASAIDSARRSGYIEDGDTVVFSAGWQERSPEAVVATARGTFTFVSGFDPATGRLPAWFSPEAIARGIRHPSACGTAFAESSNARYLCFRRVRRS